MGLEFVESGSWMQMKQAGNAFIPGDAFIPGNAFIRGDAFIL
jgi:hypothetical protein